MKSRQHIITCAALLLLFSNQSMAFAAINEQGLNSAAAYLHKKDYPTAYFQFLNMARSGCPYSQCIVGIMHQKGIGAEKNAQEAISWFERSAAQDFPDAEYRLGKIHLDGKDVKRDTELAAQWLEKAARHGQVVAQYELGKLDVTERSATALAQGRAWLREAASHGYAAAQVLVAKLPQMSDGDVSAAVIDSGSKDIQQSWNGYASAADSLDKDVSN